MYYAARQQHIEWLKKMLADEEAKLIEAQALVDQLQGSIVYYKQALEQMSPTSSGRSLGNDLENEDLLPNEDSRTGRQDKNFLPESNTSLPENEDAEEESNLGSEEESGNRLNPKDMLLPEFQGKTLGDIAEIFLKASEGRPLSPEDIAKRIFQSPSMDDFQRAKNSLSTELRRGAKEGRWKKNGRGMFSAFDFDSEETLIRKSNGFYDSKPLLSL